MQSYRHHVVNPRGVQRSKISEKHSVSFCAVDCKIFKEANAEQTEDVRERMDVVLQSLVPKRRQLKNPAKISDCNESREVGSRMRAVKIDTYQCRPATEKDISLCYAIGYAVGHT